MAASLTLASVNHLLYQMPHAAWLDEVPATKKHRPCSDLYTRGGTTQLGRIEALPKITIS